LPPDRLENWLREKSQTFTGLREVGGVA